MIVIILLSIIIMVLVYLAILATFLWKKLTVFLTYNTRYQSAAYEQAIMATSTPKKITLPPKKTEARGRQVVSTDDLVDLSDLDWETGYKALEDIANGA